MLLALGDTEDEEAEIGDGVDGVGTTEAEAAEDDEEAVESVVFG